LKYLTLVQFVTPPRRTLLLIVLLLLAGSLVSLANPWIAGILAQAILDPAKTAYSLQFILIGWLGLLLIRSLLSFATQFMVGSTGVTMAAGLRSRIYEHLQVLPLRYHQDRRAGDLLSLLGSDAEAISGFVSNTLVQLLPQMLLFAGALAVMAWIDPVVAALAVLLLPGYYLATKIIGRRMRPLTSELIRSWSGMMALAQENLGLLPVIKAFVRERLESQRFSEKNAAFLSLSRRQILVQALLSPTVGFLAGAGLLLLLWVGSRHLASGELNAAELVSLLLYAMLLTQPISALANVYGQVMRARGAADRLLELFGVAPEPSGRGKALLSSVKGEIEFDRVSFRYPGRDPLLREFTLHIRPGETVALTGPNGAGKSTLAHLLMRFVEPDRGRVLIDGCDIGTVDLASLREQIGLVAQHTLLLNGTVAENIRYGAPLASDEGVRYAAAAARADEFIANLPERYETVIGDHGIKLSGGQRQRLSLARTLLKDPAILILDEATAMFDPEGEKDFIESCRDLLRRKTVILITHRPASLAVADRVIAMDLAEPGQEESAA